MKKQNGYLPTFILIAAVVIFAIGFTSFRLLGNSNSSEVSSQSDSNLLDSISGTDGASAEERNSESANDAPKKQETDVQDDSDTTDDNSTGQQSQDGDSTNADNSNGNDESSEEQEPTSQARTFTVDSFNFGYSRTTINVNPGDTVTINLTNSGGNHDWVIDEISGAATEVIKGGQTDSITFTVPQSAAGKTYKFYCSVGNHRAQGMEGNFVVSG